MMITENKQLARHRIMNNHLIEYVDLYVYLGTEVNMRWDITIEPV